MVPDDLTGDLQRLARALEGLDLGEPLPGDDRGAMRDWLLRTITSYLIPRMSEPAAPLCVVFAGPTGAGKSTLVNSLARRQVSKTGPLRPTTDDPVVLTGSDWSDHFGSIGGVHCRVVIGQAEILSTLAFVDTPDIDSTLIEHRNAAETLIDHADVVVFVTSALRYADRVPWEVLRRAVSRGAPLICVLNRLSSGSSAAVGDYRAKLAREGLDGDILRVPEYHLGSGAHAVPSLAVKGLGRRLTSVASDRAAFQSHLIDRVVSAVVAQVEELADAIETRQAWTAKIEEQIRDSLRFDADAIESSRVVEDLGPDPYPTGSRRRARRWLRRNRLSHTELVTSLARIRRRLVAAVETDLRLSVLESSGLIIKDRTAEMGRTLSGVGQAIGTAVEGWFEFVDRMAQHLAPSNRRLAIVTLIEHSLGGGYGPAVAALFPEPVDDVSERARRDLSLRLDDVYGQVGDRLAGLLHELTGDADAYDLRASLASVARRSLTNA